MNNSPNKNPNDKSRIDVRNNGVRPNRTSNGSYNHIAKPNNASNHSSNLRNPIPNKNQNFKNPNIQKPRYSNNNASTHSSLYSSSNLNNFNRKKQKGLNDYLMLALILLSVLLVALIIVFIIVKTPSQKNDSSKETVHNNIETSLKNPNETENHSNDISRPSLPTWNEIPNNPKAFIPITNNLTVKMGGSNLYSKNAIMVDLKSNIVIAEQDPDKRIYPASLTKLMTIIVAAENIKDMYDTFELTYQMLDPLYKAKATMAYFDVETPIPIIDLFYGTCLPSGADASIGLAMYVAGSEEKFVELMNEKAKEIGLNGTHFTNCTGLHNDNHYSTCRDIATILSYLMQNDFLRTVLSKKVYKTISPVGYPDSTLQCLWSARLHGHESEKATMFAAKSGYTEHANQCLASVSKDDKGNEYLIVTTGAAKITSSQIDPKHMPYIDVKYLCDKYIK